MNITGELLGCWFPDAAWRKAVELDQSVFPRPWSYSQWLELKPEQHLLLSWIHQDECWGFALYALPASDDVAHLLKICLAPCRRGTGFSQTFWEQNLICLRRHAAVKVYLEVEESNQRALSFYKKQGFESLRTIPGYYSDGAAAVTMQLML
jgi:[ribosomal protein S18]-alanine N-acetyltransferase